MLEAKAKMEAIEDKLDQLGETLKGQAGRVEMCDLHRQLAPTLKYAMRFMRWNQSGREWIQLRTWSRDRHPVQLRPWPRRRQATKCIMHEEKRFGSGVVTMTDISWNSRRSVANPEPETAFPPILRCVLLCIDQQTLTQWVFNVQLNRFW